MGLRSRTFVAIFVEDISKPSKCPRVDILSFFPALLYLVIPILGSAPIFANKKKLRVLPALTVLFRFCKNNLLLIIRFEVFVSSTNLFGEGKKIPTRANNITIEFCQ